MFFFACVLVLVAATGLGWLLAAAVPPSTAPRLRFPPMFAASTVALGLGSWSLSRAVGLVRREKQLAFRRQLLIALVHGTTFVALQGAALQWLLQRQPAAEAQTGDRAFVAVFAGLHALHFVVAIMFLIFVALQAHHDRYDHEYYWGVSICAWFWHGLGLVWCAVLAVVAIAFQAESAGARLDPQWDRQLQGG
jgi:heme/copper-type cytochrome/quinol oxidase subunit 3